jgi:hypothetical protein
MSLSNSTVDGVLSIDLVKSSVLNEEMRKVSQDSPSQLEILVTGSRGRHKNRYSGNRDNSRRNSKNKYKDVECYNCGQNEHI